MCPLIFRNKLFLGCALAVAVVAGLTFWVCPREPTYEGKPFSYWVDQLPSTHFTPDAGMFSIHHATGREENAEKAVTELGGRCLPTLLRRLKSRDTALTRLKTEVQSTGAKLHLWTYPPFGNDPFTRRGQAVTALILLGDTAKPILPELIKLAQTNSDPDVQASAAELLQRLPPDDRPR